MRKRDRQTKRDRGEGKTERDEEIIAKRKCILSMCFCSVYRTSPFLMATYAVLEAEFSALNQSQELTGLC